MDTGGGWTDLLTRQNETRHLTGWTVDQRVSAGKWQCPRETEKKGLTLFLPSPRVLGSTAPSGDSGRVLYVAAQLEYRGDLCLEDITDPSVRVTPPTGFSPLSSAQKRQSHTVTIATRQMWPNFQLLSFCACCFSWPPVLSFCTDKASTTTPTPRQVISLPLNTVLIHLTVSVFVTISSLSS